MYAHRHVRQVLSVIRSQTKHRHQIHVIIITLSVIFLIITTFKHVKLRHSSVQLESTFDMIANNAKKVDTYQEFDYDVELTEEEKEILRKSFRSADFDNNKLLTETEISMAINRETKNHIVKAMRNNFKVFFSLDKLHKNGQVDWDEYYQHYMRDKMGLGMEDIKKMEDNPTSVSRDVREAVANVKAAWSEAAKTNPEAVNIDEFLGLEHPESSHSLLTQRVEELMDKHDIDGDGKLTMSEYKSDPYTDLSEADLTLKEKEFQLILDQNKDGIADKREIVQYLDPKNPHWSRYEAINLLSQADRNDDNLLDLDEVFAKPDLFLFSKFVSGDAGFHGEF